jgi:hypothetical protein
LHVIVFWIYIRLTKFKNPVYVIRMTLNKSKDFTDGKYKLYIE